MNKEKALTLVGILVLCIALVSGTFAYFSAQAGGTTTRDVSVTSNTTDNLSFSISNDISFTASTANFYQGGNNVSGEATATATLIPNNKTNQATMNYYMYLNLTSNPITYSSTNTSEDPELILQVFDGNDELVTLTGLGSQVALGNGYGYDITGQSGLITLLDNHTITANNATEVETWRVVITLVNLGVDQNDNGGKTVTGEIIMQKEAMSVQPTVTYVYWNDNYSYLDYYSNEIPNDDTKDAPAGRVYNSVLELAAANDLAYENYIANAYFADSPAYIKSSIVNGNVTGHETCLWYNNSEFCLGPNYWQGNANDAADVAAAQARLKSDMENALGVSLYNSLAEAQANNSEQYCGFWDGDVRCYIGNLYCSVDSYGNVCCGFGAAQNCNVHSDGMAYTYWY